MVCHECGTDVEPGQRYCTGCGTSLRGVTDTTETVTAVPDVTAAEPETPSSEPVDEPADEPVDDVALHWGDNDPVWAATAEVKVATSELPSTEPITEVEMTRIGGDLDEVTPQPTPYDFVDDEPTATIDDSVPATAEMPATAMAPPPPSHHFHFSVVMFLGVVTGLVTLVAVFANILSITSDTRIVPSDDIPVGFRTGDWILDDFGDNLSIAGLLAVLLMVAGGLAASFGWRWGAGLAAGGGLAFAGIASIGLGLAQMPIDAAHEFAAIPSEQPFVLEITRDLGYWLLVASGALGIVLFFASINDALADRRPGLNPWVAALGALATVVAAAGPLIPENLAVFSDNWYLTEGPGEAPALLLVGRLVQLGLLALTGVLGFLMVRRYGLGLAIGGSLPIVWMAASVLFDLTDSPVGPGYGNPGATDTHIHGVTIIGISALAAMSLLAVIAAYDQGVRERP